MRRPPIGALSGWIRLGANSRFNFQTAKRRPSLRAQRSNPWPPRKRKMDCFAALAMTANRSSKYTTSLSRREAPESLHLSFAPGENRGRGECRVPAAPAASCALCSSRSARVTTSTPESPGIPARNGFNGVCRALPGDRALLPPSSCEYGMSAPGRADMPPQNLTPASGRQDHTIWPSATTSLVRVLKASLTDLVDPPCDPSPARRCRVHRIPHPTSVTIAIRPSLGPGW